MTALKSTLSAVPRTLLGRKVKDLRAAAQIPANIYRKRNESAAVTLEEKEFMRLYSTAGETTLIYLTIQGETSPRPVLIRDAQRHPVTNRVLHVDFQQVDLSSKVSAKIPVETIGESEAVKGGAVLVVVYNEIEIEALPTDLPEKFEINLSKLSKIGDTITMADLVYDKGKIHIELEDSEVLATAQAQEAEVVEPVVAEPVEVELTKQGATKEVPEDEVGTAASAPAKEEGKEEKK